MLLFSVLFRRNTALSLFLVAASLLCHEALAQTVKVVLQASPNPVSLGSPVTLTASVSPFVPGETVAFFDAQLPLGSAKVNAQGNALLAHAMLSSGGRLLRAELVTGPNQPAALSASVLEKVTTVSAGSFSPWMGLAAAANPNAIALGDFNGDGFEDIAAADFGGAQITILLGDGKGGFQPAPAVATSAQPITLIAADFNGDGFTDLVEGNSGNTVEVYLGNGLGGFRQSGAFQSGGAYDMAAADFNGDGIVDLVVTTFAASDGMPAVYLGQGDGSFQLRGFLAVSAGDAYVIVGDFNGDSLADIVLASPVSGSVSVYLGNGDGSFQAASTLPSTGADGAVAEGDFNGDGKVDLAVTTYYGISVGVQFEYVSSVQIYLGRGDGTFETGAAYTVPLNPNSIASGDFDANGVPDLVVTSHDNASVTLLIGHGDGTFSVGASFATGPGPSDIHVGELNGDGRPDFVVADASGGEVSVLLGSNPGYPPPTAVYTTGATIFASGNAQPILVSAIVTSQLVVNAGTVTFAVSNAGAAVGTPLAIPVAGGAASGNYTIPAGTPPGVYTLEATYGGSANFGSSSSIGQQITISPLRSPSSVSLVATPFFATLGTPVTLTASLTPPAATGSVQFLSGQDFLGGAASISGTATLSTVSLPAGVQSVRAVYLGSSSYQPSTSATLNLTVIPASSGGLSVGPMLPSDLLPPFADPYAVVSADFNGDGIPDLAIAEGTFGGYDGEVPGAVVILLGNGDSTFRQQAVLLTGGIPSTLVAADFNGDGTQDLVAANVPPTSLGGSNITVLLGNGDGSFQPPVTTPGANSYSFAPNIAVGDFNGDGLPDVAAITSPIDPYATTATGEVLLGKGDGSFLPPIPFTSNCNASRIATGDFNNDGHTDLALAANVTVGSLQNGFCTVNGKGDGTMTPGQFYPTNGGVNTLWAGDFNGDGITDLIISDSDVTGEGLVTLFRGTPTGTLEAGATGTGGLAAGGLTVADVNGDGFLDVVTSSGNGLTEVLTTFLGDSAAAFPSAPISLSICDFASTMVAAAFNSDGRTGLALLCASSIEMFQSSPPLVNIVVTGSAQPAVLNQSYPLAIVASGASVSSVDIFDGNTRLGTAALSGGNGTFNATFSTVGQHAVRAVVEGTGSYAGSASSFLLVIVTAAQTITFPAIPPQTASSSLTLAAISSSGLPVAYSVVSGPAELNANVLSFTGVGLVTVQASQGGSADYLPAAPVSQSFEVTLGPPQVLAVVNAASYSSTILAPDSYFSLFGSNLGLSSATGDASITTQLGGLSLPITDSTGKQALAGLSYAGLQQVNFLVPEGLASGAGTLRVTNAVGNTASFSVTIGPVSPGLFTANASGAGVAAGSAVSTNASGGQVYYGIAACAGSPIVCTAASIPLSGAKEPVYLILYGTGFRGAATPSVTIGGVPCKLAYSGAQGAYAGLDQLNIEIDPSLAGRGLVDVVLTADQVQANTVQISVQ